MSHNPFVKVTALQDFGAHKCRIDWELDEEYDEATFIIRRSPDGERNIALLKSDLEETIRSYEDEDFDVGNRTSKLYYQVIMRYEGIAHYSTFVEASGRKVHVTEQTDQEELQPDDIVEQDDSLLREEVRVEPVLPVQVLKPINRELGIIKQIQKLELLNMSRSGVPCAILKPKKQGVLSHEGIDQDTDQELNVFGEGRYGRKFEGGFEEPVYTQLLGMQARPDKVVPAQGGEGEDDKYLYKVRMLGEPQLKLDDVIVDLTNDFRYAVDQVRNYQFRGEHNVILDADLVLLPRTDVIYNLAVDFAEQNS